MRALVAVPVLAWALTWLAVPAFAQDAGNSAIVLTAVSGGMAFSDVQHRSASYFTTADGTRDFDESVSAEPTLVFGVGVGFSPRSHWGVHLKYMAARTTLASYTLERGAAAGSPDPARADVAMDFLGGNVVFRLPIHVRKVSTYGVLGAGAVRYRTSSESEDGQNPGALPERTRFAGNAGLGARVPLRGDRLALEFELADYVSVAPWSADELAAASGTAQLDAQRGVREVKAVNHVSFSVGFRYALVVW